MGTFLRHSAPWKQVLSTCNFVTVCSMISNSQFMLDYVFSNLTYFTGDFRSLKIFSCCGQQRTSAAMVYCKHRAVAYMLQCAACIQGRHPTTSAWQPCMQAAHCSMVQCAACMQGRYSVSGLTAEVDCVVVVSQCLFMLLLLLIAKGWTITCQRLDAFSRLFLFTVWSAYSAASVALFLWNQVT